MPVTAFEDHFSGHAAAYGRFRPDYPDAFFALAAQLAPRLDDVWDCGTGNGQAAVALAKRFARVEATDASEAQVSQATPAPGVTYRTAPAEASGLPKSSVDLVCVAQALHWFEFDRFWPEVRRVTRPDGVFVAITYAGCSVDDDVDGAFAEHCARLEGDWPARRAHVEAAYETIPFPMARIQLPPLTLVKHWRRSEFLGYLNTWSAAQRFATRTGEDPLQGIRDAFASRWPDAETPRAVTWAMPVLAGYPHRDPT
jgi:SAM-dependent methyltransferase